METKPCAWCGTIMVKRARSSKHEWERKMTCGSSCGTYWKWHRKPKWFVDEEIPSVRICECCNEKFVRKETEHLQSWIKRRFCSKSCAATGKVRVRIKPPVVEKSEAERLGCITYVPGTPEFNQIAALYM